MNTIDRAVLSAERTHQQEESAMRHEKHGPKSLAAIIMLAIALMVITPGVAQATEFTIEGKTLSEWGLKEESVAGNGGPFQLSLTTYPIAISCNSSIVDKGSIMTGGLIHGTFLFSECKEMFEGKVLGKCEVSEPIMANVSGQLIPHWGAIYSVFTPLEKGKPFLTFSIAGSGICPMAGENNIVKGGTAALLKAGESLEQPLTFGASDKLLKTGLLYGANPMVLQGGMTLSLNGKNAGKKWAAIE